MATEIPCDSGCSNLIDSYPSTNRNWGASINGDDLYVGQAFTMSSTSRSVCCAKFMTRWNNAVATVRIEIFASTGTVGSSAVPTGTVLGYSDSLPLTTADHDNNWVVRDFKFSTPYTLSANTDYIVMLKTTSYTSGVVDVGYDNSSPTHAGNYIRNGTADSGSDTIFYMYYTTASSGWSGTINGITNPSEINEIAVANISNINGV